MRSAVIVAGEPDPELTLLERMQHHAVPGVAIAVIEDGKVAWTAGYGVAGPHGEPIEPSTRFQVASISKVVNALAVVALAGRGAFRLDDDVDVHLRRWNLRRVDDNGDVDSAPVSIRQLLSHTAGTSTSGFPGHAVGAQLPTLEDVLDGRPPANSTAVRLLHRPGSTFAYSGGGAMVLHLLIEDVTGRPYTDIVRELVLGPLGMVDSTFAQPPDATTGKLSHGHDASGTPLPGGWRVFSELAAAGLWSSALDLARLVVGVQQHLAGERDDVMTPEMAAQVVTPVPPGSHGLGPAVVGEGAGRRFQHNGTNVGFCCQLEGFLEHRSGVVVMTNADGGNALIRELLVSIADAHGWCGFDRRVVAPVPAEPSVLAALAGTYESDTGRRGELSYDDGQLFMPAPGGRRVLIPIGPMTFVDSYTGVDVVFVPQADGGGVVAEIWDGAELVTTYVAVG